MKKRWLTLALIGLLSINTAVSFAKGNKAVKVFEDTNFTVHVVPDSKKILGNRTSVTVYKLTKPNYQTRVGENVRTTPDGRVIGGVEYKKVKYQLLANCKWKGSRKNNEVYLDGANQVVYQGDVSTSNFDTPAADKMALNVKVDPGDQAVLKYVCNQKSKQTGSGKPANKKS